MPRHITSFDTEQHHIHLEFFITSPQGIRHSVAGILDTGAPKTEFSDQFLVATGCLASPREDRETVIQNRYEPQRTRIQAATESFMTVIFLKSIQQLLKVMTHVWAITLFIIVVAGGQHNPGVRLLHPRSKQNH